jgi:hypothetical protein
MGLFFLKGTLLIYNNPQINLMIIPPFSEGFVRWRRGQGGCLFRIIDSGSTLKMIGTLAF